MADRRVISDQEAASLVGNEHLTNVQFNSLSRWARQLAIHHQKAPSLFRITHEQSNILIKGVDISIRKISPISNSNDGEHAIYFLGNALGAIDDNNLKETIIESIGNSLLHGSLPASRSSIESVIASVAAVASSVAMHPTNSILYTDAICWLFSVLVRCIASLLITVAQKHDSTSFDTFTAVATLYSAMRTTVLAALPQSIELIQSMYGIIRSILISEIGDGCKDAVMGQFDRDVECAVAVMAAGGMLEGLLRSHHHHHPATRDSISIIGPLIQGLIYLLNRKAKEMYSSGSIRSENEVLELGGGRWECRLIARWSTGVAIANVLQSCQLSDISSPSALYCIISALVQVSASPLPTIAAYRIQHQHRDKTDVRWHAATFDDTQTRFQMLLSTVKTLVEPTKHTNIRLSANELDTILNVVSSACRAVHQQYRQYILEYWMPHTTIDHRSLQMRLERYFVVIMDVLTALSHNIKSTTLSQGMPVKVLSPSALVSIISDIQFARPSGLSSPNVYNQYETLLKSALTELPLQLRYCYHSSHNQPKDDDTDIRGMIASLLLPQYEDLIRPLSGNKERTPTWLMDALSASKMQLLFTALVPCCSILPEALLLDTMVPLAFLYILYPHKETSESSHRFLWSVFNCAKKEHVGHMLPMYVIRTLEGLDGNSDSQWPIASLSQGLSTALSIVHNASLSVLCIQRILGKCTELILAQSPCTDDVCVALFAVASQQLLVVQYDTMEYVLKELENFIRRKCPDRLKPRLCEKVMLVSVGSDDCVRKPPLATWYQNFSASFMML